ncbi:MAG: SDR family NAD(P)-dependent oxidoreductase [Pseudonocardiaceae bacterium]
MGDAIVRKAEQFASLVIRLLCAVCRRRGAIRTHLGSVSRLVDAGRRWGCARAAPPTMIAAGRGAIVTTSSVNSFLPDPAVIDYSASKAALANFSKSLSKEVGSRGIRVNTVSRGPVSTALWLGEDGVAPPLHAPSVVTPHTFVNKAAKQCVPGRFTHPNEVADLVVLLASDRTANVTGADFVIDGGLVTTL